MRSESRPVTSTTANSVPPLTLTTGPAVAILMLPPGEQDKPWEGYAAIA